jgi:hypothetical protein
MGLMGRMLEDTHQIQEVAGRDIPMGDAVKKDQISCN